MITIIGPDRCVFRAAGWLRKRLSIPNGKRLDDAFEQHFNCRVVRDNDLSFKLEFDNDAEATAFLLRWS